MTEEFDPWADVLVAEIAAQKIQAPQFGFGFTPRRASKLRPRAPEITEEGNAKF